jgi:hypothetical protein
VHRLKVGIENIGVEIPVQTEPVSGVIQGEGEILPRPNRAETLKILGRGSRRAVMRFAQDYPERVVKALNPDDLPALQNPPAAEKAFHQQFAKKRQPGDYDDHFVPVEEREIGFIPYQPGGDPRIKYLMETYGLSEIKPKVLTDEAGKSVSVEDYARSGGEVVGNLVIPFEEVERTVRVPDIAGAIGAKNAERVIAALGLVDTTRPEAISGRQAVMRTAIVNYAEANEIGLSPDFIKFTVNAFLFLAEHPELRGGEVIPALLKQKK